jgi:peptidoglycan/LPS O-acetylase OafA/YrhL
MVLVLIAGVTLMRDLRIHDGTVWYRVYFGPDTRADSLLIGCALGLAATANLLPRSGWAHRGLRLGFWLGLLALGLLVTQGPKGPDYLGQGQYVVYTLAAVATAAVIAGVLVGSPLLAGWALRSRPLTWVGRLSYGFYLWHLPIAVYLHPTWVPFDWLLPLHVVVTVAVVSASYYLVERRFLRLKSKLRSARSRPREVTARELALAPVSVPSRDGD